MAIYKVHTLDERKLVLNCLRALRAARIINFIIYFQQEWSSIIA
jgi:hypothetical protein